MVKIKLYNRDRANLELVRGPQVEPGIFKWSMEVDKEHSYIFKYCRVIFSDNDMREIIAIDPSGGPFISVGDELENKYKIVRINNVKDIWISETNYDK